ncbi:MAG: type II secretion system protein [Patescibacteria group bacterium]
MKSVRANAGFTLVELIIVMAIMGLLLAMSAPFVSATRSDISMSRTIRVIKTDLMTNLGYALAGKSIGALSADALLDPEQIPSHYALYFQKMDDYGGGVPYSYLEFHPLEDGKNVKVSYMIEKEWPSSDVYLKEIRLSKDDGSAGKTVDSGLIFFTAPFGKINFVSGIKSLAEGDMLNLKEAFLSEADYKEIELVLQYKNEELSETTLSFSVDKYINVF